MAKSWREAALPLLGWLDDPRDGRGIRVFEGDAWRLHTYGALAQRVSALTGYLCERRRPDGERVAVVSADPILFVVGFFGALSSGATAVPVAPPTLLGRAYPEYLAHLLETSRAACVVVPGDMRAAVEEAVRRVGREIDVVSEVPERTHRVTHHAPANVAIVQFTSGSTSKPRGVKVSTQALHAQLGMLRAWLNWGSDDSVASWLPLHHDMGLVGACVASICAQSDLWYMTPDLYLRRPLAFWRCLGEQGVSLTTAPTFGYAYAARHVRPEQLAGTDFSNLRTAVVGAERIDPNVLSAFMGVFAEAGLRPEALRPAYGLAEATLAVSGTQVERTPSCVNVDWSTLAMDAPIEYGRRRSIAPGLRVNGSALVSCGRPMDGTAIDVVDSRGAVLPDGYVGEISVQGPALALGYEGGQGSARFVDGTLLTGDAGFMAEGELYVIGRMTDSVKVRGRRVYVEPIEDQLAAVCGVPVERCVVVPGHGEAGDEIVVLVERPAGEWVNEVVLALMTVVGQDLAITIYAGRPHSIPKTTSGKKRRLAVAQNLVHGRTDATLVFSSRESEVGASAS